MNIKSLRFRLTIWYAFSLTLAIAVIFASFYFIINKSLYNQTDSMLTSHGDKIIEVITRRGTDMHQTMAKELFLQEFYEIPGMLVVVMNNTGNIVSSSQTIDPQDKTLNQIFDTATQIKKPFFENRNLGTLTIRFYIIPVIQNGTLAAVVFVGHPIDVIIKSMNNLLFMLGVVFIVLLIPSIVGGYLHAKGATQPISGISEKLKKITSENLDDRLKNPKTGDEIEELTLTFNNLLDRLHNAFVREKQFIGDIAHELKTPLSTARSNIEVVLSKDRTKEEYKKTLSEALIDNNRIATTLKNILDLAWSEAENARTHPETINLTQLVEEIKDLATKMAIPKKLTVNANIMPNIKIAGKQDKLFRAILNIVDNAIKYTAEKGTIILTLNKDKANARLIVKDNGAGISKEDLPHIFERFYRGSKADKTFGSGLGLSITQAIIIAHRGSIGIESKIGRGTTVTINFSLINVSS